MRHESWWRPLAWAGLLAAMLASACATAPQAPAGSLSVICEVPDATLVVDDVVAGRVGAWSQPRPVRAGFHRIEVRQPGHYSFFAEVTIKEDQLTTVTARLRPLLE